MDTWGFRHFVHSENLGDIYCGDLTTPVHLPKTPSMVGWLTDGREYLVFGNDEKGILSYENKTKDKYEAYDFLLQALRERKQQGKQMSLLD